MTNLEKYREVFTTTFGIGEGICALEEAFDIMFDTDDIIDLNSYKTGMQILRKYEVVI